MCMTRLWGSDAHWVYHCGKLMPMCILSVLKTVKALPIF